MDWQPLLLEYLTTFRGLLFLCCIGYWWMLYAWVRPSEEAVRYGTLAALVQFWIGLLADMVYVSLGLWVYRPMPFSIAGVPLDLHLDWSLLWGFGLVWLADRILGNQPKTSWVIFYLSVWSLLTVAFDIAIADWMIFLETVAPSWWLADLIFLFVAQGFTLWFYRSIGKANEPRCGLGPLPPLRPYFRSFVYLSFALPFFFIFLPEQVEIAATGMGFGYLINSPPTPIEIIPWVLIFLAVALGGWATHEFACRGHGTPIPWDPPRYLVNSGPYAITANPMQQAGLLLTLAVLLMRPSWIMFGFFLDVIMMAVVVFAVFEPGSLQTRFSQAYEAYRAQIKPWHYKFQSYQRKDSASPIVFYDAECGLCQTSIWTLINLDVGHVLQFAPLFGETAKVVLPATYHNLAGQTIIFWEPQEPSCLSIRSRAILRALGYMPLPICFLAAFEGIPGVVMLFNLGYRLIATIRSKLWPPSPKICSLIQTDTRYLP